MKCKRCGWEGLGWRCLACKKKQDALYRLKYPERIKESARRHALKWRETDREGYNAKRRRYRKKSTYDAQYLIRSKWLLEGTVIREQLFELYERSKGKCKYCGCDVRCSFNPINCRGFDHVVPRIKGGKHEVANMVVACKKCNELKGDKHEYARIKTTG